MRITLRLLTALALAGSASAGSPWGLPSFFGGSETEEPKAIGNTDVKAIEFPAFGNFSWKKDGTRFSGLFGMIYRTHQHVVGRARVGEAVGAGRQAVAEVGTDGLRRGLAGVRRRVLV